jgi:hypothetical protein
MDIGAILLKGVSGITGGGVIGAAAALATGYLDLKKKQVENKHQLDMLSAQKELVLAQGQNAVALEKSKATAASYENDRANYGENLLGRIADFFRAIQRPGITDWLLLLSTGIVCYALWKTPLANEAWADIARVGVYACLDTSSFCISWWFGSRQIEKIGRK